MKMQSMSRNQTGGRSRARRALSGFTLMETIISLPIAGVFVLSLYGLFGLGFDVVGQSREDLRATQIMLKQLERIRVCPYNQLTNTVYNPQTLTDYFDPTDQPAGGGGAVYTVTFSASVPASGTLPESYRTNMLLITVGTTWTSGKVQHTRSMQTYVAQNGMESYIAAGQ
jgi:Tfp pilus assembly protein PilV